MSPIREVRSVLKELHEYPKMPQDVHIGDNSADDKVVWLVRRLMMVENELAKERRKNQTTFLGVD